MGVSQTVTSASGHRIEVHLGEDGTVRVVGHDVVDNSGRRHPVHGTAMYHALRKVVGPRVNVTFEGQVTTRVYRIEE